MNNSLFFLVVFVAVLAIAPFTHSAAASEVRSTSNSPIHHILSPSPSFPPLLLLSLILVSLSSSLQVQSQFLRLADQLDSSIHRFHSSQRAADLDEVDDSINALEQRSSTPAVTSLTLRSYLAQREQILYAVAARALLVFAHPLPSPCILTLDSQVFNAAASKEVSRQPRHSARIHPPHETRHVAENGSRAITITLRMQTRDILPPV